MAQNNLKNENYFKTASPVDAVLNFSVDLYSFIYCKKKKKNSKKF